MDEHIRHSSKYVLAETIEGGHAVLLYNVNSLCFNVRRTTTTDSGVNILKNKNPKPYDVHIKQYKLNSIVEGMAFIAALD